MGFSGAWRLHETRLWALSSETGRLGLGAPAPCAWPRSQEPRRKLMNRTDSALVGRLGVPAPQHHWGLRGGLCGPGAGWGARAETRGAAFSEAGIWRERGTDWELQGPPPAPPGPPRGAPPGRRGGCAKHPQGVPPQPGAQGQGWGTGRAGQKDPHGLSPSVEGKGGCYRVQVAPRAAGPFSGGHRLVRATPARWAARDLQRAREARCSSTKYLSPDDV